MPPGQSPPIPAAEKQQVRGSSPLASSKRLVRPAFLFGILDRPPGNPQLSDPIVLVLLQPGVDLGSLPPKILPDLYPRRPGAFLALPIDRVPRKVQILHWIFDVHKPVIVLGNGPNALASLTQSLPAPAAVLAQTSLQTLPVEPLRKISFDVPRRLIRLGIHRPCARSQLRSAALAYASAGIPVFPLATRSKVPLIPVRNGASTHRRSTSGLRRPRRQSQVHGVRGCPGKRPGPRQLACGRRQPARCRCATWHRVCCALVALPSCERCPFSAEGSPRPAESPARCYADFRLSRPHVATS